MTTLKDQIKKLDKRLSELEHEREDILDERYKVKSVYDQQQAVDFIDSGELSKVAWVMRYPHMSRIYAAVGPDYAPFKEFMQDAARSKFLRPGIQLANVDGEFYLYGEASRLSVFCSQLKLQVDVSSFERMVDEFWMRVDILRTYAEFPHEHN